MAAPAVRARAKAAIVGAFVADAATMPLHWIYDTTKIDSLLSEKGKAAEPEFYDPPSCPFYSYDKGQQSPYGDEILPLLRYVSRTGQLDAAGFAEESRTFLKAYKGRLNHCSKLFLEALDAGKPLAEAAQDDSQAHGIIKVPILVARYAGHPELLAKVEEAVRVHQNNDVSVGASLALAKVLERVVLEGSPVPDAVDWAASEQSGLAERERTLLQQARSQGWPSNTAIKDFGMSCALPGALLGSVWTAAHAPTYVEGVRSSAVAGGDNCSRNVVIGALLAAAQGLDSVPAEWRSKASAHAEVDRLADAIVDKL